MWYSGLVLFFAGNTLEQSVSTSSEADTLITTSTPEKWKYHLQNSQASWWTWSTWGTWPAQTVPSPTAQSFPLQELPPGTGIRSSPSVKLILLSDLNLNPIQPKPHMSLKAHFHCTALWSNRRWLCNAAGPSGLLPVLLRNHILLSLASSTHLASWGASSAGWASSIGSLFQQYSSASALIPWSGSPDETCSDGTTRRKRGREQDQAISQELGKDHFTAYNQNNATVCPTEAPGDASLDEPAKEWARQMDQRKELGQVWQSSSEFADSTSRQFLTTQVRNSQALKLLLLSLLLLFFLRNFMDYSSLSS